MHHIALNGTGADDRHFDHQIIKTPRTHTRQKVHLRTTFHLKHTDAVRCAQHIVDPWVFGGQRGQRMAGIQVGFQQIKGFADASEHPKAENIDFKDAQRLDIVLVPTNNCAPFHCRILNWHQFVQPPFGHNKPAHMLAEMARKTVDLVHKRKGLLQARIIGIEADLGHALCLDPFGRKEAPKLRGKPRDRVFGQPHSTAHFADSPLAAIMHHGRAQPCTVPSIALIDVLNHLFAAFVFKIHVNVRRFVTSLGHKAFKHHRTDFRRNGRDTQTVTDD